MNCCCFLAGDVTSTSSFVLRSIVKNSSGFVSFSELLRNINRNNKNTANNITILKINLRRRILISYQWNFLLYLEQPTTKHKQTKTAEVKVGGFSSDERSKRHIQNVFKLWYNE